MNNKNDDFNEKLKMMAGSSDFLIFEKRSNFSHPFTICYFKPLVDPTILHEKIMPLLNVNADQSLDVLFAMLPITEKKLTSEWKSVEEGLLKGYAAIRFRAEGNQTLIVDVGKKEGRNVQAPEIEFSVIGPKEAFVESITANLNLLRKRLPVPEMKTKEMTVGNLSKSKIAVCYMEGITNEAYVNTVIQRIEGIDFDFVLDSSMLSEMIEDSKKSIFPQLLDTERPDRVAAALGLGQFAVFMDGSPHALIGPVNFALFLVAYEDYYLPWHMASFFRLLRFFAVSFSIIASSLYVAATSYHYEVVSTSLLSTLISSRADIPFPPIIEALVMELTIDLLREAGARLPSKIAQTIGTVGGIVIGTAAIEAALTSNVLLVIVALSALASFTTPNFRMSTTIRILRYPFLLGAEWLGLLGIFIVFAFLLVHLLRLKSIGAPYLVPVYPLRLSDLNDSLIRLPYSSFPRRPSFLRTRHSSRKSVEIDEE
ncbi:spore germination protein [Cohnella luojiensis]|nr:spore germination protein [Cohnella luojiensis]